VRKILTVGLASALALILTGPLQADEPRGIIEKAIKAAGGEEKLAKAKAQTWTEKGTYYGMGNGLPYTGKYAVQWPGKFRMEIENAFIIVLNGDKGWIKSMGETKDMTAEQLEEQKREHQAGYVATLVPLKDKAYTLAALGEIKVGDRPAVGVKISHKDIRDVSLYFDKETNLLVRSEWRVKSQEQMGKEMTQEALYADYKEVDGVKIPMKITINRDGKVFVEAVNSDVKLAEKLDDKTFEKP
jgi:outer membrane lipoprotein-sorting protein